MPRPSIHQLADLHTERVSNLANDGDRRVSHAALYAGDVGAMDVSAVGELFLGPAFLAPDLAHILCKALANIHALIGH